MLSRRKFFAILAVGAGLAGTWSIGRTLVPDDKEVVRMLLDKELSYLKVDVKEYHRFAEDILSEPRYGKAVGMLPISVLPLDMLPRLLIPAALVQRLFLKASLQKAVLSLEERMAAEFLMGSDFFMNGKSLDKPVKYIALYRPHARPCQNPFAVLFA